MDEKMVQCKKCGNEMPKSSKFCQKCGAKNDKPFYTKWWFIVIAIVVLLAILASLGGNDDTEANTTTTDTVVITTTTEETTTEETTTEETTTEETTTEETSDTTLTDEEIAQLVLIILEDSLKDTAEVEYDSDNNTFNILPTDPNMVLELYAAQTGDEDQIEAWNSLADNFKTMSESISEFKSGYIISMLNPSNPENTLFMVMDGIVLYDFIED